MDQARIKADLERAQEMIQGVLREVSHDMDPDLIDPLIIAIGAIQAAGKRLEGCEG